jgi:hypothetical protein
MLPSLQQLSRAGTLLRKLPSASAPVHGRAASNAIKRFLATFSSEPALSASSKSALSKVASQLGKQGGEKAEGATLLKALAPFGV